MRAVGPDRGVQRPNSAGDKRPAGSSGAGAPVARRSRPRRAGTAAVGRIVAGARPLQRTPTTLTDVAVAKRKGLTVDTREVKWSGIAGGLKSLFTNKDVIVAPRAGLTVNTSFGGAIAKPGGGDADEKRVRTGLERIGILRFSLDDHSTADPI